MGKSECFTPTTAVMWYGPISSFSILCIKDTSAPATVSRLGSVRKALVAGWVRYTTLGLRTSLKLCQLISNVLSSIDMHYCL